MKKPLVSALTISFAIAYVAWLIAEQFSGFECEIFERLISIFAWPTGIHQAQQELSINPSTDWFSLCSFVLFAFAASWSSFKLSFFSRIIVSIQIFVLSLIYQWALWSWFAIEGHPLGYLLCIGIGCLFGVALRKLELARRENETRYYELKIRNKELQETRLSLVKQDEIERRMLAADLHDQVLNDMKLLTQRFESFIESGDQESLQEVRSLSGKIMFELREVMESLCPSVLEHLGLVAAVEDCLRKGGERAGFKFRFRSTVKTEQLQALSLVEQSLFYRLVQESITNTCKHAGASVVRIVMDVVDNELLITITDDGIGIGSSKQRADSRGLRYMRLRADLIGATIAWKPGDNDKGTRVEIRLDLTGRQAVQTDD